MIMYAYRATFSGKNFSFSQSASLKNITYKKQVWAYKAFSDSQTIVKVNPFGRTRTSMLMVSEIMMTAVEGAASSEGFATIKVLHAVNEIHKI